MDKLLPCPFCGSAASIWDKSRYDTCVRCDICEAQTNWMPTVTDAITAWNLRVQPENEPLTLDELRQMDGEPVWVSDIDPFSQDKCSCWAIVGDAEEAGIELYDKFCDKNYIDFGASELYGKTWLAYRSKPKEE